jgi:protocatechuate 3,4-dioxygenase beta subunit
VLVLIASMLPVRLPAASCKQKDYEIHGTVTDRSGRPIPGARVHVLLDKISQKEFGKHGVRARSATGNERGTYQVRITCGGEPNPCAAKPKHLSVAASKHGYAMILQVFPFKELEIVEQDGRCFVRAPNLQLRSGF